MTVPIPRRPRSRRIAAIAAAAALMAGVAVAGATATGSASGTRREGRPTGRATGCHLGNGIKHVVEIMFDNVHFYRDNPNVPSDLELMPNLLNFFTSNGTVLTNNHTPLIAHTADDILSTYSGLYGDRHGNGISNSYQAYNSQRDQRGFQHHRPGVQLHVLDRPDGRHGEDPERGARHQPEHGLLAGAAGHRRARRSRRTPSLRPPGCPTPRPAVTGVRSPPRTWS